MPSHSPLKIELPNLHQDGSIKFRIVLSQARNERRLMLESERRGHFAPLAGRHARVRSVMAPVRERIAHLRAFHAIENVPTHAYEKVRVEASGRVWDEMVYVGPIAPVAAVRKAA